MYRMNMPRKTGAARGAVTRKAASVARRTNAGKNPFRKSGLGVGRKDWL